MTKVRKSKLIVSSRPPKILLCIALLFLAFAALLSPELLISAGPMRKSLTSDIPLVQKTAHIEIQLLRLVCVIISFLFVMAAIRWRRILDSRLILYVSSHTPVESPRHNAIMRVFNGSLLTVTGAIIISLLYVAVGIYVFDAQQLVVINEEDGVIEYATALLFLTCSVASMILAFRFHGRKAYVIVHGLFAIGFFLCFGEEISWGQRILNFGTPAIVDKVNVQRELNLHNLLGYFADHLFILAVFVYGCVLPALRYIHVFFRKLFSVIGLPIASPGLGVGFLLVSLMHDWTLYRLFTSIPELRPLAAELRELLTSIAFSLLMYESWLLSHNKTGVSR